jgi:hypothetical protein
LIYCCAFLIFVLVFSEKNEDALVNYIDDLTRNKTIFFNFMKERYEVHYKSNIFLRDILYAIKNFYEKKGQKIKYPLAEELALQFTDYLVCQSELIVIDKNAWKVNFSFNNETREYDIQ